MYKRWLKLRLTVLAWQCRRQDDRYILSIRDMDCGASLAEHIRPSAYRHRIKWEAMVKRHKTMEARLTELEQNNE